MFSTGCAVDSGGDLLLLASIVFILILILILVRMAGQPTSSPRRPSNPHLVRRWTYPQDHSVSRLV